MLNTQKKAPPKWRSPVLHQGFVWETNHHRKPVRSQFFDGAHVWDWNNTFKSKLLDWKWSQFICTNLYTPSPGFAWSHSSPSAKWCRTDFWGRNVVISGTIMIQNGNPCPGIPSAHPKPTDPRGQLTDLQFPALSWPGAFPRKTSRMRWQRRMWNGLGSGYPKGQRSKCPVDQFWK